LGLNRLQDVLLELRKILLHPSVLHHLHPRLRVQVLQVGLEHLLVLLLKSLQRLLGLSQGGTVFLRQSDSSLPFLIRHPQIRGEFREAFVSSLREVLATGFLRWLALHGKRRCLRSVYRLLDGSRWWLLTDDLLLRWLALHLHWGRSTLRFDGLPSVGTFGR